MSIRDTWRTPMTIVACLDRMWPDGIDLDPCTGPGSLIRAGTKYTENGTSEPWRGYRTIYANPPYSEPHEWVMRMVEAAYMHSAEVIGCLRCDPSVSWWKDVWTADAICFPAKRVQFIPPEGVELSQNNGPNALPYWGPNVSRFKWAFRTLGKVVEL